MNNFVVPPHKTISQIIEDLQKIKNEHGDLPICVMYEDELGLCFDFDQVFEMIRMSDDLEDVNSSGELVKICAYTYPPEPEPYLRVIRD